MGTQASDERPETPKQDANDPYAFVVVRTPITSFDPPPLANGLIPDVAVDDQGHIFMLTAYRAPQG